MPTLSIDPRFNGPPDVANGGYVCASLALPLGGTVETTLWRPVPVGTDLELVLENQRVGLTDAHGKLLAEARPGVVDIRVPEPVSIEVAESAMARSPTRDPEAATFPCFVCSATRADGFQVTPGPVPDRDVVAAVWRPGSELGDAEGRVSELFAWAVLDCTGSIGASVAHGIPAGVLLGRMTAEILSPILAGETLVAVGWSEPAAGTKLPACAVLFRKGGEIVGRARLVCFVA